jgi:peptidoglycan/xylan/chitin deacetylase (PgdA/CDA1 family)
LKGCGTLKKLFLTFDTEDFISENSIPGLNIILRLLKKHKLPALFFITGNMAEKLSIFPDTVELLNEHQIGYHSSSHSIHPTIFEFTDVKTYKEAYQASLIRETTHVNPLTGAMEGPGGIHALKALFPKKQIIAFRAPGYCWTPPHLEAMKTLGITYDFSTNISIDPFNYHGITFYPFPLMTTNWQGGIREHSRLQLLTLRRETSVLTIHPSKMVNRDDWDLIYYPKFNNSINPTSLTQPSARTPVEITSIFHEFDLLLRHLRTLQRIHLLDITSTLKTAKRTLIPTLLDAKKSYEFSVIWAEGYGHKPQFICNHFLRFFEANPSNEKNSSQDLPIS